MRFLILIMLTFSLIAADAPAPLTAEEAAKVMAEISAKKKAAKVAALAAAAKEAASVPVADSPEAKDAALAEANTAAVMERKRADDAARAEQVRISNAKRDADAFDRKANQEAKNALSQAKQFQKRAAAEGAGHGMHAILTRDISLQKTAGSNKAARVAIAKVEEFWQKRDAARAQAGLPEVEPRITAVKFVLQDSY